MSWHCGSVAAAEPTRFEMRCKRCAKCAQIHGQTSGGTWERPRVSSHGDRDCGGEGQGRGHPHLARAGNPPQATLQSFGRSSPRGGRRHPSLRPGLIQDFRILDWHQGNGS